LSTKWERAVEGEGIRPTQQGVPGGPGGKKEIVWNVASRAEFNGVRFKVRPSRGGKSSKWQLREEERRKKGTKICHLGENILGQ